jgi:hypothetical protein
MKQKLPKGLRARKQKSGRTYYYLEVKNSLSRKEIALGCDLSIVISAWKKSVQLNLDQVPEAKSAQWLIDRFAVEQLPLLDAKKQAITQRELSRLLKAMQSLRIDQATDFYSPHFGSLATSDTNIFRARRDESMFAHVLNWAKTQGYVAAETTVHKSNLTTMVDAKRKAELFGSLKAQATEADWLYLTQASAASSQRMPSKQLSARFNELKRDTERRLRLRGRGDMAIAVSNLKWPDIAQYLRNQAAGENA